MTAAQDESAPHAVYKIVLMGADNVGKTAVVHRFKDDTFSAEYTPTVGVDFVVKDVTFERDPFRFWVKLQLWDTAGQERFQEMLQEQKYRDMLGAGIMYDITNRASFERAVELAEECAQRLQPAARYNVVIIANKVDCAERVIERTEGEDVARKYGWMFMEVSAATGKNVHNTFALLGDVIHRRALARVSPTALPSAQQQQQHDEQQQSASILQSISEKLRPGENYAVAEAKLNELLFTAQQKLGASERQKVLDFFGRVKENVRHQLFDGPTPVVQPAPAPTAATTTAATAAVTADGTAAPASDNTGQSADVATPTAATVAAPQPQEEGPLSHMIDMVKQKLGPAERQKVISFVQGVGDQVQTRMRTISVSDQSGTSPVSGFFSSLRARVQKAVSGQEKAIPNVASTTRPFVPAKNSN
eukprot:TRINITY_DN1583_c0_g1_i1.p1 TRINITY_DN1583_c0_g1~~TRINITY_DN1583_c0_g1_i1.p1  ORF type:complete len:418 (-),score=101.72 TRINITY_DN1583_c0_g1_i1:1752-3005(-)